MWAVFRAPEYTHKSQSWDYDKHLNLNSSFG